MPVTRNGEPLTSTVPLFADLGRFHARMVDLLPSLEAHLAGVDGAFFTSHAQLVIVPPDAALAPWQRGPRVTIEAGYDPERYVVTHPLADTSAWPPWSRGQPAPVVVRAYADTVAHALACVSIAMVASGGWVSAP